MKLNNSFAVGATTLFLFINASFSQESPLPAPLRQEPIAAPDSNTEENGPIEPMQFPLPTAQERELRERIIATGDYDQYNPTPRNLEYTRCRDNLGRFAREDAAAHGFAGLSASIASARVSHCLEITFLPRCSYERMYSEFAFLYISQRLAAIRNDARNLSEDLSRRTVELDGIVLRSALVDRYRVSADADLRIELPAHFSRALSSMGGSSWFENQCTPSRCTVTKHFDAFSCQTFHGPNGSRLFSANGPEIAPPRCFYILRGGINAITMAASTLHLDFQFSSAGEWLRQTTLLDARSEFELKYDFFENPTWPTNLTANRDYSAIPNAQVAPEIPGLSRRSRYLLASTFSMYSNTSFDLNRIMAEYGGNRVQTDHLRANRFGGETPVFATYTVMHSNSDVPFLRMECTNYSPTVQELQSYEVFLRTLQGSRYSRALPQCRIVIPFSSIDEGALSALR